MNSGECRGIQLLEVLKISDVWEISPKQNKYLYWNIMEEEEKEI